MAAILGVFCLLLPLISAEESSAPWFCHGKECPQFALIRKYETFEERYYNVSRWIMTSIESTERSAVYDGFMKLYQYFNGENERNAAFEVTVPVTVTVSRSDGESDEVSISFYVPPDANMPKPIDDTLKNVDRPDGTVYVRVFSGIATEADWMNNINELQNDLTKEGKAFDHGTSVAACYDPPLRLFGRHNEVWIPAGKA